MDGVFGDWLRAVIYTGIVCSLVLMITPEGRVKKALRLLCAAVMCAAIASPLAELDFDAYSKAMAKYKLDAQQYTEQGAQYSKNLNRTIIEDECRAYILDKAAQLNVEVREAAVTAQWSISDGCWYPCELRITADCGESEKARLEDAVEAGLGISAENQEWNDGTDGG